MYEFRPGGFEDDESDEDGFFLGSIGEVKTSKAPFNPPKPADVTVEPSRGRGGFGTPKPKPADNRGNFRRSNPNKPDQSTAKILSVGDFQNAVVRGNTDVVRKYLDEGFEVDTVLQTGWTPLLYAASGANEKVMKLLLDRGANPKFQKDMYYVLMAACGSSGYKEADVLKCVNLLLDRGAEVNVYDRYHMSSLMCAARVGHSQVIERLIEAGANINKQDSRGWTSLTWAVSKGNLSAVRSLLKAGADPKMKHCDGQNAIDIAVSDEMIALLGGEVSQKALEPAVAMAIASPKGDSSVISKTTSGNSASNQYGTTYGELELFLCGLDLNQLVPLFQAQHVEFSTFLRLTEEDLIKMGITQIGVRKKILDGIMAVHKREWEKSSLPAVQYNKTISCPESIAMVANVSKHTKYITTTIGFVQDQIKKHPSIVEVIQDGSGPKQLHQHLVDTQRNVTTLHSQLETMKTQLEQILQKGNYDPPDLINKKKLKQQHIRLYCVGLAVVGGVVITLIRNRQTVIEKVWNLFPR